jgi:hypothetical protein
MKARFGLIGVLQIAMLEREGDDQSAGNPAPEPHDEPESPALPCAEPEAAEEEEAEDVEVEDDTDEGMDEDELPVFLQGEGWTLYERAHAYALYLSLPADVQPTVVAVLAQPGICIPDVVTMPAHITAMDEAQREELVRHARGICRPLVCRLPRHPRPRAGALQGPF